MIMWLCWKITLYVDIIRLSTQCNIPSSQEINIQKNLKMKKEISHHSRISSHEKGKHENEAATKVGFWMAHLWVKQERHLPMMS